MAFGRYTLIREDENGVALGDPLEVAEDEYPAIGHAIDWDDGSYYRVRDVRHRRDPDERSDDRVTLHYHVYARRIGPSQKATEHRRPDDIPVFREPAVGVDGRFASDILPAELVSVLVLAGYDSLKIQLRKARRDNAHTLRATGCGAWVLVRRAWDLSRSAKRFRNEVAMFISSSWPDGASGKAQDAAPSARRSSQELAPSLPPTRPTLRLV